MGISKGSYGTDLVVKNSVLIKCKTDESCIEIPSSVKSIGKSAFKNCKSLTSVIIPDSVTDIGDNAFEFCDSLTGITIPDSVTNIGYGAFFGCHSLTTVTIGNAVASIGGHAFSYCSSLTSVTLGNSVSSIGSWAFSKCRKLAGIVIPEAVTSIEYGTFSKCVSLEYVIMGNSVTQINRKAFEGCISLTTVDIPDSISFIHKEAFEGCYSATIILPHFYKKRTGDHDLVLRDTRLFHRKDKFKDCENVIFRPDSPELDLTSASGSEADLQIEKSEEIGDPLKNEALYNSSSLTVNEIAPIADSNNSYGTDLVIKRNVLKKCKTTGTCIEVPTFVKSIGKAAFKGCTSLTNVTIPDSVTSIGNEAFSYCTSLVEITIPDSVISIGKSAFWYCESLATVMIGTSVCDIGDWTFVGCESITSIVIPESVTVIKCGLFRSCASLSSIMLGNSVTKIEAGAFRDCISLTGITVPDSIKRIANTAFDGCTNLTIAIPRSYKFSSVKKNFSDCKEVIYKKNRDVVNEVHSGNLTTDFSECENKDGIALTEDYDSAIDKSCKDELLASDKFVFISYSTQNQEYAETMRVLLKENNIKTWMAPYNIPAGAEYAEVINEAVENCSCVLLVLSEKAQKSPHVKSEIRIAFDLDKPIVSIHIDGSTLTSAFKYYLGNKQIVSLDSTDKNNPNIQKILADIKKSQK